MARLNNRFLLNHLDLHKDYIITAHGRIVPKDREDDEGGATEPSAEGDEAGLEPTEGAAHVSVGDNGGVNNGRNNTNGADVHSAGRDKPKSTSGKGGPPRNNSNRNDNTRGNGRGGGAPPKPRRETTPSAPTRTSERQKSQC